MEVMWIEVAGSDQDQDRAVRLELTSPYLVRGFPFDLLPVLPKCTFQASCIETVGLNSIFKCWTRDSAPDSPLSHGEHRTSLFGC